MVISEIVLWTSVALIVYGYFGYPLVVLLLSLFVNNKVQKGKLIPKVTLLITAFNEEEKIAVKLENSLKLDYPSEQLEIIVASDGSTDKTDEIVKQYTDNASGIRVVLHRVEGRLGKTAAQNSAVEVSHGEIIVFSDADSMYDSQAIQAIVRNYVDPSVGAVSGMYTYDNASGESAGFGTTLFWKLENFIKQRQTKIKTITGCCGCIYSVRKELYQPLPPEIISDLVEPLMILRKGFRVVFEPEANAIEETAGKTRDEFRMRIRVIVRGMKGMFFARELFNPLRYPFISFQLFSHKVLRWFVSVLAIIALVANMFLAVEPVSKLYIYSLFLQLLFYSFACMGWLCEKRNIHFKLFYLPLYFCIVNLAVLVSIYKVMRGENIIVWQTER